jgi:hypothetical protein
MITIDEIFGMWGSVADMSRALDMPYQTVSKWQQRQRIPSSAWEPIIEAARLKKHYLTFEQLAKANVRQPDAKKNPATPPSDSPVAA